MPGTTEGTPRTSESLGGRAVPGVLLQVASWLRCLVQAENE